MNQAHLENELELNGLKAPDELQINTLSHNTVNANADRTKATCRYCRKTRTLQKSVSIVEKTARTN